MNKYAESDSRIRIINNVQNLGLTKSLNIGINCANGEYVARLDADDIAAPSRLEKQINYLRENSDVVLVGTGVYIIDENGEVLNSIKVVKNRRLIKKLLLYGNLFIHSSLMVKKDALVGVGKYRSKFIHSQDYDLVLRLNEHYSLANLSEPLTCWRFSGTNSTVNKFLLQRACADIAIQFARERMKYGRDSYDSVDFSKLVQDIIDKNKKTYEWDFSIYSAIYAGHLKEAFLGFCSALVQGLIPKNTMSRAIIGFGSLF
jgi:glycosyltransferase involved in cell wall biosynthesis